MVGTYAIETHAPTNDAITPPPAAAAPTRRVDSVVGDDSAPAPRGTELRVRLESLPVPLRVAAGGHWETGMAIEAELPWLALGTALDVELPGGGQRGGRIQAFEVDVTPSGSACLRIFADLSAPGAALPEPMADRRPEPTAPRPRSWLRPLLFVLGASIGVHAGIQAPPLRALVSTAHHLVNQAGN
jgi:hypothetical protein